VLASDATRLESVPRAAAFLAVAGSLFAAGALIERFALRHRPIGPSAVGATTVSLGLALAGISTLLDGTARGFGLLGVAAVFAGGAAAFLRSRRDYSTFLWVISLGVAAAAATQLLSGQWLVVVYALGGAALAWLAVATGERRLQLGSLSYLGGAVVTLLIGAAPPQRFFEAAVDPGSGVPAVLAVAAAIAAFAAACGRGRSFGTFLDKFQPRLRTTSLWAAGTAALYGISLAILELFELIRPGTVESSFQSGHTAVSATWGVLGLALLYLGLRRASRPLQLGGFALFGVSLAKLFLYDLAQLSSITRALSFLAVGAVLLVAGFFYQRLSSLKAAGSDRPAAS
jgi:hypothetical protein